MLLQTNGKKVKDNYMQGWKQITTIIYCLGHKEEKETCNEIY